MDKKIKPPPPVGRIASRWILFLTFFHLLPTPWFLGVAAGLAPASFLTAGGLASLFNTDFDSFAFVIMLLGPGLVGILVFTLAAYLLAALIGRLQQPTLRTFALLAIVTSCSLAALQPIYIYGSHSGGDAFSLLDFIDILGQFRIPEAASIGYFVGLALLLILLLVYQQVPNLFPALPFDHLKRRRIIRWSLLTGIILIILISGWVHRTYIFVKPLADFGFAPAQYQLAMTIKDQPGASKASYRLWLERAAKQGHLKAATALARSPKSAEAKLRWLNIAAEGGVAEAQYELYRLIRQSSPTSDQIQQARDWLLTAADHGHANAQNELGRLYIRGDQSFSIKLDFEAGRKWWEQAAENGSGKAMRELAWRYEQGVDGFPRDSKRAVAWRRKLAEGYGQGLYGLSKNAGMADSNLTQAKKTADLDQKIKAGDPEAMATLGRQLMQASSAAAATKTEGLALLEGAATNGDGDRELQYEVGAVYMFGNRGIDKDFERGRSWWDRAAELNHVRTLTYLAPAYQNGRFGYPVDLLKSKALTEKLVAAYGDGRYGVDPDPQKEQYWRAELKYFDRLFDLAGGDYLPINALRSKAVNNSPAAQYQLGRQLLVSGAKKERAEGLKWIEQAAEGGLAEAQYRLVTYYENKLHIMRNNPQRGIAILESAARQNHLPAMATLALGYYKGRYGLTQDYRKAKKWYEKLLEVYASGQYQGELNDRFIDFQKRQLGYTTKALKVHEEKTRRYEQASPEERKIIAIEERYHKMYERAVNALDRSDGSREGKKKFRAEVQRLRQKYIELRKQEIEKQGIETRRKS